MARVAYPIVNLYALRTRPRHRRPAGLTQPELARRVGISTTQLLKIEHGAAWASRPVLRRLSRVLQVTYARLTGGAYGD